MEKDYNLKNIENIFEELRQKYDYKWQDKLIELINNYDIYIWNMLSNIVDNNKNDFCMLNIPYHITLKEFYENIYKNKQEEENYNGKN